jgi:three-Cys-motif partner protein
MSNIDLKITTILVEEEQKRFRTLLESLHDEGLGNRVKNTTNFSELDSGEIAVINGNSVVLIDKLIAYTTQKYTWAFYLIDPYGPSGIPRNFVQSVVQQDRHDVMINFVYYDLEKKAGSINTPSQQEHVGYWTKAFGDERWIEIKREIERFRFSRDLLLAAVGMDINEAKGDPLFEEIWENQSFTNKQLGELTERKLVDLYRTVLLEMDSSLAVKTVRLHFADKDRTMFYLFLTTHDGTGALKLNEILNEAKYRERDLRYIRRFAKKPSGQTSFLGLVDPELPAREVPDRPKVEECAEDIIRKLSGKTLTRRNVYKELADEIYFHTEIDNAIKFLRGKERADYNGGKLSHNTVIRFF